MISVFEAKSKIDASVAPLPARTIPIMDTIGCKLARPVISPINVPDFVSSIMDGIAIRHADLVGDGPWTFPVQATIGAGQDTDLSLLPNQAVKIMTGGKLVPGSDTVIKVEDVVFENGSAIIRNKVERGNFVRPLGDDIQKRQSLFKEGTIITPLVAGVLASIGLNEISVIPHPTTAVFSTGREIIEPGQELKPGQRYDSNRSVLMTLLAQDGIIADASGGIIPDESGQLEKILEASIARADLIITSGGVSMGDFDYLPNVIRRMGGDVLFHKVRVKPGKPVLIAKVHGRWIVGLPGNPVSVVAGYHLHVRRLIARLMGKEFRPRTSRAILAQDINFPTDRFGMLGARLEERDNEVIAMPVLRQQSGRLSSVADINGFILLDEKTMSVSAGETVDVEWLY